VDTDARIGVRISSAGSADPPPVAVADSALEVAAGVESVDDDAAAAAEEEEPLDDELDVALEPPDVHPARTTSRTASADTAVAVCVRLRVRVRVRMRRP
jgi:hypothetical protein